MTRDRVIMVSNLGDPVVTDAQGKVDANVDKVGDAKALGKQNRSSRKRKKKAAPPVRHKDPRRFISGDDRRWCYDCLRLVDGVRCTAPESGLLIVMKPKNYEPMQSMPRRCIAYLPCQDDPDQTPGAIRWPWLIETK